MPILRTLEAGSRAALVAALLLAAAVPACGGGADAEQGAAYADDFEGEESPARIEVEPCSLLTNEEISEQLFLSLSADEQSRWTSREFDLATTEPELGVTRMCEYKFQSRYAAGGGPTWHSDFDIMVFPSNAIALSEEKRRPIAGAGPEMFKEPGTAAAYYVVKGNLAVSLHRFPGRKEESDADAGRVALLRRIAERLP